MNVTNVVSSSAMAQETNRTPVTQLDKDAFLQILAAQLKYQDPLSGGDNTQYVTQLAQFSTLEQMQNLNTSLSEMLYLQYMQYGSQLVGKSVTLNDGQQEIQGVVEKLSMRNGDVNIIVNGISYKLYQLEEINITEETSATEEVL